jgi:CRP-like cAMP-binding protein
MEDNMDNSDILITLEKCELFKDLEKVDIEKIAGLCQVENFGAREYIFHQGDVGEKIYIVTEGSVFLERSVDLGSRKGNRVIGIFGIGKAFGCWSAILDEPHDLMSSAICKNAANIVSISGTRLRKVLLEDPELGFKVMEKICLLLRDRIQDAWGAMERI